MQRVAAEPVLHGQQAEAQVVRRHSIAANDAWGWKLFAGLASVAAVAAIAWNFMAVPVASGVQAAASAAVAPVAVASQEPVMIRDPRLDELLAAHKQFGGNSALQAPAGFLRNATFEVPSR
jgi:sigma-E factor negative regulatory protein RseA